MGSLVTAGAGKNIANWKSNALLRAIWARLDLLNIDGRGGDQPGAGHAGSADPSGYYDGKAGHLLANGLHKNVY